MTVKDMAIIQGIKSLASAVMLQAAKDYCDESTTDVAKSVIVKELKGEWMDFLTNGTSKNVARELLHNEKEIKNRLNVQIGVN